MTSTSVATAHQQHDVPHVAELSPLSMELVIGLVGYAGAGCSTTAKRLSVLLQLQNYTLHIIKLSDLIERFFDLSLEPPSDDDMNAGDSRFRRACTLQDFGDEIRNSHHHHAVAALTIKEIIRARGEVPPGSQRIAFILDSIKHVEEVHLLRNVYGSSFRLLAVHCDRKKRENRLIGAVKEQKKYSGVPSIEVLSYMDRDEKDQRYDHGQQVRDAFHLADFFLDNNLGSQDGSALTNDLERFVNLILGSGLIRPNKSERAMYHAYAAAFQSSCLSRQVGSALMASDGSILATGTNDVPRFGGGVYDEDSKPDNRCVAWEWNGNDETFVGCHNQRRKELLRRDIAAWLAEEFTKDIAEAAHPLPESGMDTAQRARQETEVSIKALFAKSEARMGEMPGIGSLIEYSRSIHSEMNTLFSAARNGMPTVGTVLFCTTYPCHNCARHLVTAGVRSVYYIEPYVKSLAIELHYDAITTHSADGGVAEAGGQNDKMLLAPFTGVGPRLFQEVFKKDLELKAADGSYSSPSRQVPKEGVRLRDLQEVEKRAADLIPEPSSV